MAAATDVKCKLTETKGDLFKLAPDTASIAHCVSQCLTMGKGIAVQFKSRFGQVDQLREQKRAVGDVAVLKDNGRYVYYLVTKAVYYGKPTYDTLESTIVAMKQHCTQNGVKQLAMPQLGCGLDRLAWSKVKSILLRQFATMDIELLVFSL